MSIGEHERETGNSEHAPAREPIDFYLEDIRDTAVLDRAAQTELAERIVDCEQALRAELSEIPAVARFVLSVWNGRRARGLVTGALSRFHRDVGVKDVSKRVDRDVARIRRNLRRFEEASTSGGVDSAEKARSELAVALRAADIALPILTDALEHLDDLRPPRWGDGAPCGRVSHGREIPSPR